MCPRKRSYNQLRGSFVSGINWPKTGSRVEEMCVIDLFWKRAGDENFDLPTASEWELAARAGYRTRSVPARIILRTATRTGRR